MHAPACILSTAIDVGCCMADISAHGMQQVSHAPTYEPMSGAVDPGRLERHMQSATLSLGSKSDRSDGSTDLRDATAALLLHVEQQFICQMRLFSMEGSHCNDICPALAAMIFKHARS